MDEDWSNLDLIDAFDGIDPEDILASDPTLATIARDISRISHNGGVLTNNNTVVNSSNNNNVGEIFVKPEKVLKKVSRVLPYSPPSLCAACNGPSEGVRSFGAVVCMSCRQFFIRSTKNSSHQKFACQRVGPNINRSSCYVNSKSWKSCQKCRFDRCLKVGMVIPQIEGARTPRRNNSQKSPLVVKSSRPSHGHVVHRMLKDNLSRMITMRIREQTFNTKSFTSEDMSRVEQYLNIHVDFTTKVFGDLARLDIGAFRMMMEFIFEGKFYPVYMQKQVDDYQKFCARDLFLKQTGYPFDAVKANDRLRLAVCNGPLVLEYVLASKLGKTSDNEEELDHIIGILTNDPDPAFGCQVKDIYCKV